MREVPPKKKAEVVIEWAKYEQYLDNPEAARKILLDYKTELSYEWKIYLELTCLEMRQGNHADAIKHVEEGLKEHPGTGRLWALFIQLKEAGGLSEQHKLFKQALHEVPKSGEVWCEGARIALHKKQFEKGEKYLNFAIHFTPQYGDSFVEWIRLESTRNAKELAVLPDYLLGQIAQICANSSPNYGSLWNYCRKPQFSIQQTMKYALWRIQESDPIMCPHWKQQNSVSHLSKEDRWNVIVGEAPKF